MEIICSCALRNLAYPNATSVMVLPIAVMERTNPEKFVVKVLFKKFKKNTTENLISRILGIDFFY